MCAGCALAAMTGASGVRAWLQAHHLTWLTPRRMRIATIMLFAAAALGSSLVFSGSTPPAHHGAGGHVAAHQHP